MIDNLTEAIEKYNDFIDSENATARALRANNDNSARFYEETAENDKKIVEWLTELQERREADRWIPVSERLPNTLGVYNVTRKIIEGEISYVISDACYFDGQNTWHADTGVNHGRPYITDVIAWKPKPEPYESEASK